jgi:quinolinate synthase
MLLWHGVVDDDSIKGDANVSACRGSLRAPTAAIFIVDPETDENVAALNDATGSTVTIKKTEKRRARAGTMSVK